jgi:hypothetical protein
MALPVGAKFLKAREKQITAYYVRYWKGGARKFWAFQGPIMKPSLRLWQADFTRVM